MGEIEGQFFQFWEVEKVGVPVELQGGEKSFLPFQSETGKGDAFAVDGTGVKGAQYTAVRHFDLFREFQLLPELFFQLRHAELGAFTGQLFRFGRYQL